MTRINVIPPSDLNYRHLIAEYRELPRILALVRKAIERGEQPNDPRNPVEYVLGTGHCRFFYARLGWLQKRMRSLVEEMDRRGYKTTYTDIDISEFSAEWCGDYKPTEQALMINKKRIVDRLSRSA